jgi:thiamine pyrophosphokinase
MRALVFANGDLPSQALIDELRAGADLVVAADGGVDKAAAAGVEVDAIVGDFDSVSAEARSRLPRERFHHEPALDATDLEKAVRFCVGRGCTAIDVVAAGGGRADHALANLSILAMFGRSARVRVVDDRFEVSLVDGEATVEGPPGTVVSLVAVGRCQGVTTRGLRWDLSDRTLVFSPLGIHNEILTSPVTVSVHTGDLLLFKGRWVEKHG